MALWLVRAGPNGEQESLALEKCVAVVGWTELPDLTPADSREKLAELMKRSYPEKGEHAISNYVGQIWAFRGKMQKRDLVVLPLKTTSMVAVGEVTGPYRYEPDNPVGARHTRPVKWLRDDIPREAFGQDLLYSFGAFMTVCQIARNDAEARTRAVLQEKEDPLVVESGGPTGTADAIEGPVSTEELASDQIRKFLARKFKGHELARLVECLLRAQGYVTLASPPGPDGGVDILAGKGPLGFEEPNLCVQVKSGSPADVDTLRKLQGTMTTYKARQGLLVSWNGFNQRVLSEGKLSFFMVRFWDADDVIRAIFDTYEKLSDELRAELPLKRVWALVLDEAKFSDAVADK